MGVWEGKVSMDLRDAEKSTRLLDDSMPEDVAALYRWAGLTGAKYRDYSAERRERRARLRYQAAQRALELQTKIRAEAGEADVSGSAEDHPELAAGTVLRALEAEREMEEAQESARRKQQVFAEAERLRRERTGDFPGSKAGAREDTERHTAASTGELISQVSTAPIVQAASDRAAAGIRPAWLEPATAMPLQEAIAAMNDLPEQPAPAAEVRRSFAADTLLDSREQVALRWPVLQALALELRQSAASVQVSRRRGPVAMIISPAGGAGATSLAAMLTRVLAKDGERVLLVQTITQSMLPLYFGLGPSETGELRATVSRDGENGAAFIFRLDVMRMHTERAREAAAEVLMSKAQGFDRIMIDLAAGAEWLAQKLSALRPMVLAPVAPEMSSVAGLPAMEQRFAAIRDKEGRALLPFYLLNRFHAGLPLHLDIREVLRRELDDRLLPVAVQRSAAVGEALAQGTTVLDYAPDSPVARNYTDVARWLEQIAPASAEAIANVARGGL